MPSTQTEQTPPAALADYATQEIRVATVLNGGVSLAVWMSGVVLELHHAALSSMRLGQWQPYRQVLDLLGATVRVDVVAGTSAGGVNGAFLALGLARRRDLALLRDLWTDAGSLADLLRPAMTKNPPSVLRGDDYFLVQMREALQATIGLQNPDLGGTAPATPPPVELILTGTLWSGRESAFTDDMGVGITERDYDATFRFANQVPPELRDQIGDLDDTTDAVVEQLARAARCTSSFPAAFEPHLVVPAAGTGVQGRWPMSAGQANFANAQYVLDGGILLNKPVRPALEAIYRQPGQNQIRRVLAYVVPDPGEPPRTEPGSAPGAVGPVPQAGDVLLSVLTRLRSTDSVSRELAEIRDRNATVSDRRRARARLCAAMSKAETPLSDALWDGYIAERIDGASIRIGHLITAGQLAGPGRWSEREITDAMQRYAAAGGFSFVPQSSLASALADTGLAWRWGETTVVRLMDMSVDLLRRGLALAPLNSDVQQRLVDARRGLEEVLRAIQADNGDLNRYWLGAATGIRGLAPIPPRQGSANATASNLAALDAWLGPVLEAWDSAAPGAAGAQADGGPDPAAGAQPGTSPEPASGGGAGAVPAVDAGSAGARRTRQYRQSMALAQALFDCRDAFDRVREAPNIGVDSSGGDRAQLSALHGWLLAPAADAADVLARMLRLDVVLVATTGGLGEVEQEVELVQMSCSDRDRVTGMQLHHFGAFYRAPWRVNDWIEGRLDGAKQTIRFLLSPARLRQRGFTTTVLLAELEKIAAPPGHPDFAWLRQRWQDALPAYTSEVDAALGVGGSTTALDEVADALAMPLRLQILRDDLATVARAIRGELADAAAGSKRWLASYQAKIAAAPPAPSGAAESGALSAAQLWELRADLADVGRQKITDDIGSDTFARTVSQTATVTASTFVSPPKVGKVRAVRFVMSALRGYTAMVWAMVEYLTRGSEFGTRMVSLAVAAGGVLLAVTILVPGVPIGLTLLGAGLLLAGVSAAALLSSGGVGLGVRLGIATALIGGALGYLVWRDVDRHGFGGDVLTLLVKLGVALLIVLLGWFVATARPSRD